MKRWRNFEHWMGAISLVVIILEIPAIILLHALEIV